MRLRERPREEPWFCSHITNTYYCRVIIEIRFETSWWEYINSCKFNHLFQGYSGLKGQPGEDGSPGLFGRKGESGNDGSPGQRGRHGLPGLQGQKGEYGEPGYTPLPPIVIPGDKGAPGEDGLNGLPGPTGFNGQPGMVLLTLWLQWLHLKGIIRSTRKLDLRVSYGTCPNARRRWSDIWSHIGESMLFPYDYSLTYLNNTNLFYCYIYSILGVIYAFVLSS